MPNPLELDQRSVLSRSLRDVIEGRQALFFECSNCTRLRRVDAIDLVAELGDADITVGEVLFKSRCSLCGKKRAVPLLCDMTRPKQMGWFPRAPKAGR